jgi:hypothetical protein
MRPMSKAKLKRNLSVKALRRVIGMTQAEFGTLLGASKDTVVSWENGRNPVCERFINRIVAMTGADALTLSNGKGFVLNREGLPYTGADFGNWRHGAGPKPSRSVLAYCKDTLDLILKASARPDVCRPQERFGDVFTSFIRWAEQTRKEFKLARPIDALLAERKTQVQVKGTYGQFRHAKRTGPVEQRHLAYHFEDDPRKNESEPVSAPVETTPTWRPGGCMRPDKRHVDYLLQPCFKSAPQPRL